ncbi:MULTISPECIES: YidH family protein [Corynebacterium]|uniref:YidH family protein n=1 Tax=Corynebacterium TaxID=1716 RepID=UPI0006666478|nr:MULTISPECIES: DUF202 domain-containing protein [Corynebacterium]ATZ06473.1 DUF202 domain-containing protein [Corynebacterium striatum]EGT5786874.1 DUF202 domain-containing protein [Corynebacterium striatum]KAA1270074.1 DUF202 domain-containing protein [Corynebacterium striatum]MDK8807226.1 DUF202 domain-containing protein [Corynebacterium striatum]MDK8825313.1 DUF202 domain-containing protein [Corynebacterium striatum]
MSAPDKRFPRSVYSRGSEPDPRFSMANERTFLAWIRTALAFIAGGVALQAFELPIHGMLTTVISVLMLLTAMVLPGVAWAHWRASESAMRQEKPLPANLAMPVLVGLVIMVGALILAGQLMS